MKVADMSIEEFEAFIRRVIKDELDPDGGLELNEEFMAETLAVGLDPSDAIPLEEVIAEYEGTHKAKRKSKTG